MTSVCVLWGAPLVSGVGGVDSFAIIFEADSEGPALPEPD